MKIRSFTRTCWPPKKKHAHVVGVSRLSLNDVIYVWVGSGVWVCLSVVVDGKHVLGLDPRQLFFLSRTCQE